MSDKFGLIGPCRCSTVMSLWTNPKRYPMVEQGMMHSPLGCLRGIRQGWELDLLYRQIYGLPSPRVGEITILFQSIMLGLEKRPDIAATVEGLILEPVGTHPPQSTPVNVEITPNPRGSRGRGTAGRGRVEAVPPAWDGKRIKPPWIKDELP